MRRPMKLWTFLFASPKMAFQSVRVAARERAGAVSLMAALIDMPMKVGSSERPMEDVVLQCSGAMDREEDCVVSWVTRDGRFVEAAR